MRIIEKFFDRTFFRFIIVGVINTIFGTSVMFIAYNVFHIGYWVSSALNYILGSILSYFLNKHFTFQYKNNDLKTVIRFILNIVICYFLAYSIAKPIVSRLLSHTTQSLQENGAMLFGMCLFVVLNYCGQRFFAFKQ